MRQIILAKRVLVTGDLVGVDQMHIRVFQEIRDGGRPVGRAVASSK